MLPTKVLFAYCDELKRSISIAEARTAFFSMEAGKRKRFTFTCSDRNCKVNISAVNYHVKAEDGNKFRAAHFRSHLPHKFGCEWIQFTEDTEQGIRTDEAESDFTERKARQKLTDWINSFDPSIDDADTKSAGPSRSISAISGGSEARNAAENGVNSRWSKYTRTNQLQRLMDSWQEAKTKLPTEIFQTPRINIINDGQVYLHKYVTRIKSGITNEFGGVVYGGGTLLRRYGMGFLINFYDKKDGKPVRLYVSKDIMKQGGSAHYIDEILNTQNVRYFRIFLLNPTISENKNNEGAPVINLEISKLRQIAIYYELNSKTEDEQGSAESNGDSPK
jgi:hypothetical protein